MTGEAQLGFDGLLASADADNRDRQFARETAHLPGSMDAALPYYRKLTLRHHSTMLAGDVDETMNLRREARLLARKLNGGDGGILAHEGAPGCVLERETAAPPGTVPLWGQTGDFVISVGGMRVRIEMEGIFGIASGSCYWPGFAARAVDLDEPFLSQTGYRSFLGIYAAPVPGLSGDAFAAMIIESYVKKELRNKPLAMEPRYRAIKKR